MGSGNVLAIMSKYPTPGTVKTRLGAALSMDASCELYRAFLLDIQCRFSVLTSPIYWAHAPCEAQFARLFAEPVNTLPSISANLAHALRSTFERLSAAGYERIVVMSSDSPHLPLAWIAAAFEALTSHDVVLGPTEDGGYYLVGQRGQPHDLFTSIPMSTGSVQEQTMRAARQQHLSTYLLPVTFDVDEMEDLMKLQALLQAQAATIAMPNTAAFLQQLRTGTQRMMQRQISCIRNEGHEQTRN